MCALKTTYKNLGLIQSWYNIVTKSLVLTDDDDQNDQIYFYLSFFLYSITFLCIYLMIIVLFRKMDIARKKRTRAQEKRKFETRSIVTK